MCTRGVEKMREPKVIPVGGGFWRDPEWHLAGDAKNYPGICRACKFYSEASNSNRWHKCHHITLREERKEYITGSIPAYRSCEDVNIHGNCIYWEPNETGKLKTFEVHCPMP
jgi:hypothetical protein